VIVLAVLLGSCGVVAMFALLAAAGFREFARASGLAQDRWMCTAVYLAIIAAAACVLFRSFATFMILPALAVALFLFVPVARNNFDGQLRAISLAVLAFLYIGWMLLHARGSAAALKRSATCSSCSSRSS
jgi:predicted CDP-diglyceride synthetase/phosphatidate cytidylyltransferase